MTPDPEPKRRRRYRYKRFRAKRKTHSIPLIPVIGLGLATASGMTNGFQIPFSSIISDPLGSLNVFTESISGYNPSNKTWDVKELGNFWGILIGFTVADWILKKVGVGRVKLTRKLKVA